MEKHNITEPLQNEDQYRSECLWLNKQLQAERLVILTWGTGSVIDREMGYVYIKPSGVRYEDLTKEHIVVVDLDGHVIRGELKPSVDTAIHLALYKQFSDIGSIVHTHSEDSIPFAQAGLAIQCLGTTQADGNILEIPVTRDLTAAEVEKNYEVNVGKVLCQTLEETAANIRECFPQYTEELDQIPDSVLVPAVLDRRHGPFVWGRTAKEALEHAISVEFYAKTAFRTILLQLAGELEKIQPIEIPFDVTRRFIENHFLRKHGSTKYCRYGQNPSP